MNFCFFKPKVSQGDSQGSMYKFHNESFTYDQWFGVFGDIEYDPNNNIDCVVANDGLITFPKLPSTNTYLICIYWSGISGSQLYPTITPTNCTVIEAFQDDTVGAAYGPQSGGTATKKIMMFYVSTTEADVTPTVQFPNSTPNAPTTGATVDVVITEVAYLDPEIYG